MAEKRQPRSRKAIKEGGLPRERSPIVTRGRAKIAKKALDDIEECLAIFTFELPDPDMQLWPLVIPQPPPLRTFTCFPKLPLELREMIWFAALPKRRMVDLLGPVRSRGKQRKCVQRLPVSLSVNYEARKLTLEHYYLLVSEALECNDLRLPDPRKRIVCIDPKVDQVWIEMENIMYDFQSTTEFCHRYEKCISQIRDLEVRKSQWCIHSWHQLEDSGGGVLQFFPQLEDIHLIPYQNSRGVIVGLHEGEEEEPLRNLFWAFQDVVSEMWEKDQTRSWPDVNVHDYRKLGPRSDGAQVGRGLHAFLDFTNGDAVITWKSGGEWHEAPLDD